MEPSNSGHSNVKDSLSNFGSLAFVRFNASSLLKSDDSHFLIALDSSRGIISH